jgi:hypothetical protein
MRRLAAAAVACLTAGWIATASPLWAQEAPAPGPQTSADEDIRLDITERHITEENFEASTALAIQSADPDGLAVQIGALVRALRIDVRLRDVQGRVRFVGSLDRIQRVLESHRPEPASR